MITKYRNPPEIAKESYIFPNWRNFAESGHTENQLSFTENQLSFIIDDTQWGIKLVWSEI